MDWSLEDKLTGVIIWNTKNDLNKIQGKKDHTQAVPKPDSCEKIKGEQREAAAHKVVSKDGVFLPYYLFYIYIEKPTEDWKMSMKKELWFERKSKCR